MNLLRNALNYTPIDGQVSLAATKLDGQVILMISDTGVGIAAKHLPHLGERFYRIDESRTKQSGGTGLGLAICKSIVEAHQGAWHITSTPEQGTVVTITLPEQPTQV